MIEIPVEHIKKFSLKDHLFNRLKVELIASEIKRVYPRFNNVDFVDEVLEKFPLLELKERIDQITTSLRKYLPDNYREAVGILIQSLPAPCNPDLQDNDFGDFIYAPYNHFVAFYGCNKHDLAFSLDALEEFTTRFSAEDAIRYFINAFPNETLTKLNLWTTHNHYHVRRLASEGTRPKLPWCQKISIEPESTLPILEQLYSDKTRYVTRSVANHLNDISKSNSTLVIETLNKWKKEKKQSSSEMDFIIRHALRTLIKKGEKKALEVIGIKDNPPIHIKLLSLSTKVKMNNYFTFEFALKSKENTSVLIDYVIHFQSKNGEMKSKKVFKLKQFNMKTNEEVVLSKKHLMRQFMSTRTLYHGQHMWQLQLNGNVVLEEYFELI